MTIEVIGAMPNKDAIIAGLRLEIIELKLNNARLKNCLKSFNHLADDEMKLLISKAIENF